MSSSSEWAQGVTAIYDEAGGLLCIEIVRHSDMPDIIARALLGDAKASRTLFAVKQTLTQIKDAPRRLPTLCACCPRPIRFRNRFALVFAVPEREDPTRFLGLAVCEKCGTSTAEIKAKGVKALRQIWPNARPVGIINQHAAGHA